MRPVSLPPTQMQQDISELDLRLRHEIEQTLGYSLQTPKDFDRLCMDLFEQQHVSISVSTLKRYWGYVQSGENYRPNRYTLRILSRYAGYADWEAFVRGEKVPELDDKEKEKQRLLDASLAKIGERLNIIYKEMDAIRTEMEVLRSLAGKTETDAASAAANVIDRD